jgi:hypothetical protein
MILIHMIYSFACSILFYLHELMFDLFCMIYSFACIICYFPLFPGIILLFTFFKALSGQSLIKLQPNTLSFICAAESVSKTSTPRARTSTPVYIWRPMWGVPKRNQQVFSAHNWRSFSTRDQQATRSSDLPHLTRKAARSSDHWAISKSRLKTKVRKNIWRQGSLLQQEGELQ